MSGESAKLALLYGELEKKMRYGDLWKEFTLEELVAYAVIKAKRALAIYHSDLSAEFKLEKIKDDLLDSSNISLLAYMKYEDELKKQEDKRNKDYIDQFDHERPKYNPQALEG